MSNLLASKECHHNIVMPKVKGEGLALEAEIYYYFFWLWMNFVNLTLMWKLLDGIDEFQGTILHSKKYEIIYMSCSAAYGMTA